MKMRNKGKVHPTPSSSSSSYSPPSSSSSSPDALSIFKLLPAAVLTLASVLSLEDKEVLAYMITRSIKATNPSSILEEKSKKATKKNHNNHHGSVAGGHKPPMFDCECFDCYTSYWCKWDSSPNRELIHQAIEAFEEHLNNGEASTKKGKNKKRDQKGRRGVEHPEGKTSPETHQASPENMEVGLPQVDDLVGESEDASGDGVVEVASPEMEVALRPSPAAGGGGGGGGGGHKGLARKVLPDVLGLFNSRLWSLWSPNV